ncbi:alkylation response protein AidB-like acyl-CoA dehydrogenase [Stella humosa]|uniref:3-methylmercaptopropionyl-CoA dehydrogenase n=1 Tax=Stella humosa TaxID=94 RepID=A0A3N1MAR6_9PROT|nr:acyl-CoA dehydrogenase [Stella humosa]ROQ00359.1 alkylation response protein AidB-like acyl-CoA dehydrogenase [Stella humosa]BBK30402.1 acyl-CoA dehydrogenase [Stella humosa]
MPTYAAPVDDLAYVLTQVLEVQRLANLPAYADLSPDFIQDFLRGAADICEGVAQPLNQPGDSEGCRWENGSVFTPQGFRQAYKAFADGGWIGLAFDPDHGGKGLPGVLAESFYEMLAGANLAFSGYIELSEAVFTAIAAHGTDAQKRLYLPKLASGEWTGAMHLTEAHAGSDLGRVRTRAEPAGDGSYRLHGSKIFITNAEHDLADNIVNLVLARLPDGPPGARGLSLFLVPKHLPDADGNPGARNAVHCASLEHKMGLRAAPTGVIVYEGAVGELVGQPHRGLQAMFTMVNDARLGVALQGLGIAEVACQNAAHYARERHQGRVPGADAGGEAQPIIGHPDVRAMLLTQRSFIDGARALGLWVAMQIDLSRLHPDPDERRRADERAALLTPVIKAHFTDRGSEAANLALQCHGGHGFIREYGIEQFVRDVRVTQLYEGTNGIQALDLVRRKLALDEGRTLAALLDEMADAAVRSRAVPAAACFGAALESALADLRRATDWMNGQVGAAPVEAAGGATDYLRLFGLVAVGWMWVRMATVSARALDAGSGDPAFHRRKLAVGRFYMDRTLPETALLARRVARGAEGIMELDAAAF